LPPEGFVGAWDLTFPKPAALGTLPVVVQLHYADGFGHRMSAPAVHVLRTGGSPDGKVDVTLEASPLATTGNATVRVTNHEDAPVKGTLRLVTSTEIAASPAERPIEVGPGATLTVPVTIENRGALDGSATAVWAAVTLMRPSWVETLTASTAVSIVPPPREDERRWATPLKTLGAIAVIALLLWIGRRLLAPRAAPGTRAARRRSRRNA